MWEDILKVQVLGSKQRVKQGIRPLPKEEKTNCKDTIRQWNKNAYDTQAKISQFIEDEYYEPKQFSEDKFEKVPEEVACKVIEIINHFMDGNERYESKFITWAEPDGFNRKFEVSMFYNNNERKPHENTQSSNISVWLKEILSIGERIVISLIRIQFPKPAAAGFLGEGVDFEEYDIKELDFRRG